MFEFLQTVSELVAVDQDPEVARTREPLLSARAQLDKFEADERRLTRIATGMEPRYTDEEMDEVYRRLRTRPGTQTGWYLPEAEEARQVMKRLTVTYQEAVTAAKQRLLDSGTAKIAALTKEMMAALRVPCQLAEEIQVVRQDMGIGGVDGPEHPCSALLPHGLVDDQLRIARERGWC